MMLLPTPTPTLYNEYLIIVDISTSIGKSLLVEELDFLLR